MPKKVITARQLLTALQSLTEEELDFPLQYVTDSSLRGLQLLVNPVKGDQHITVATTVPAEQVRVVRVPC